MDENGDKLKWGTVETMPVHQGKGAKNLLEEDAKTGRLRGRRPFSAWAAPMAWGPEVTVANHIGVVTYNISYKAVGNSIVLGRVTYYKGPGNQGRVREQFRDETTITTSKSIATVIVEFLGNPLGSAVEGSISP